jgi:hypothetical protein
VIRRILRRSAFTVGFGGMVVVLLAVMTADRALGQDVLMIAPHKPAVVELNRMLYAAGDPVPQLYGNPLSAPTRVVLPSQERLLRPQEDPALLLLRVDKQRGENPLQTRTLWFFAKFAVPGLALLGLLGFALPRRLSA